MFLYDILERKNAFLGYKIDIFPNRFIHGFAPNVAIFQLFLIANIG